MMRKVNFRRGATLAELSITLAVIAIAAVTVVSFCTVISRQVGGAKQRQAAREELRMVQSLAQGWVDMLLAQGGSYQPEQTNKLQFRLGEQVYSLSLEDGTLTGTQPDGKTQTLETKYLHAISFSSVFNETQTDYLIFCRIQYRVAGGTEDAYTFCIDSHIGDLYPGGASV